MTLELTSLTTASSASPALPASLWRNLASQRKPPKHLKGLDALWTRLEGRVQLAMPRRRRCLRFAARVARVWPRYEAMSDDELRAAAAQSRALFHLGRETEADLPTAMAIVCEAAKRQVGLRPYLVQIAGAYAIHRGYVAEMATGEGKTLVASLAATLAGWRGRGCHVITVNDYLAQRDAQLMRPIYRFCGLSVAHVDGPMPPDQRRAAYNADITYCTNKEVTADFLRDRLMLGRQASSGLASALLQTMSGTPVGRLDQLVMRGLEQAIVDEADSVLIDEAVTPLIISADSPNPEQQEAYQQAAAIARDLVPRQHYRVNRQHRETSLTSRGRARVDELTEELGGIWAGRRRRYELVTQALTVKELFLRDQHYVVRDGKIVIVDEFTGRLMPDRTWRAGVHQAAEAKEGLEIQPPKQTLARISFQRFFRLYKRLGGMTGTAWENRGELWQTYRLPVVRIPTHRRCIRRMHRPRLYRTAEARWAAVVEEVQRVHAGGRSILIGTRSVEASEQLSRRLTEAGLEHQVLNAVRHEEEAHVVEGAGQPGRITVATNMAGRGTDIKLHPDVAAAGGLHVIATERHESGRVDRQLFGRAARQGDPGSGVAITSCEDELIRRYARSSMGWMLRSAAATGAGAGPLTRAMLKAVQRRAQAMAARQRAGVLRSDDWLDEQLGFAGAEL